MAWYAAVLLALVPSVKEGGNIACRVGLGAQEAPKSQPLSLTRTLEGRFCLMVAVPSAHPIAPIDA